MVRVKQTDKYDDDDDNVKSHIAIETFNIYQNGYSNCIHVNHSTPKSSPFIDWYLILRVREDARIDTIRKQYLKLALLLHPDKNKHPKAEFAFKLISQAYKWLIDDTRRTSFNRERERERGRKVCSECMRPPNKSNSASHKIAQQWRMMREKVREEVRVIESCINLNRSSNNDCPVFDPKTYAHLGYPHRRDHQHHHHRHHLDHDHVYNSYYRRKGVIKSDDQTRRRGRCETPVFELRTHSTSFNLNSSPWVSS